MHNIRFIKQYNIGTYYYHGINFCVTYGYKYKVSIPMTRYKILSSFLQPDKYLLFISTCNLSLRQFLYIGR